MLEVVAMDESHERRRKGGGGAGPRRPKPPGGKLPAGQPVKAEAHAIGDQMLVERIFNLSRRVQALRRPSPEGLLSESEFLVLSALASAAPNMITMKELSERAGTAPSLISRLVKGLEERKHYVERLPSKEDRRQVYIRLRAEGERTLRIYIKRRIERLRLLVRELDDEERKVVWRSLEIFEAILERTQT